MASPIEARREAGREGQTGYPQVVGDPCPTIDGLLCRDRQPNGGPERPKAATSPIPEAQLHGGVAAAADIDPACTRHQEVGSLVLLMGGDRSSTEEGGGTHGDVANAREQDHAAACYTIGTAGVALAAAGNGGRANEGRQGAPSRVIRPGETVVLADIAGPGVVRRVWLTVPGQVEALRGFGFRIFWDGQDWPSVEAPLQDFFGRTCGTEPKLQARLPRASAGGAPACSSSAARASM